MYYRLFSYDKIRFIVIGGIGFVINYLMLTILFSILRLPILVAQVISAETALLITFLGNNFWTFTHHGDKPLYLKLVKFHLSAIGGLIINSSIVVVLVHYSHVYYGISLIIGSIAGLVWNYTLYKKFVFKQSNLDKL